MTPEQVAAWMVEELDRLGTLDQNLTATEIAAKFGDQFAGFNNEGGLSINKKVLAAFRKLTGDVVIWDRSELSWRRRQPWDAPGRMQG